MGVAPLVVAHRGASGIRPEHTREAFEQAIDLGADVLEVDVVATADGVLVARHDWALSRTTDVAQRRELAGWRTTRSGRDGPVTDWWVDRMTLEQVRSLRARERWPALRRSSATYDGQCPLMTLREVLDLAVQESDRRVRRVGVAVELKDVGPAAAQHGVDLVELLLDDLAAAGLPRPQVPVWVMAFEPRPLERLSAMVSPSTCYSPPRVLPTQMTSCISARRGGWVCGRGPSGPRTRFCPPRCASGTTPGRTELFRCRSPRHCAVGSRALSATTLTCCVACCR